MSLSPEERAEYLANLHHLPEGQYHTDRVKIILAQIREAEKQIERSKEQEVTQAYKIGLKKGFNAAREKAAEMVESRKGIPEHHKDLADRIREIRADD